MNQNAAQSLVNTLTSLRAVRWVGATDAVKHGIEKPNLVVTFTLADKKTGKLTIGGNTAEEMWLTTSEGKTGTFLMNKPDFDALNAALIETPKPTAGAVTPGVAPVATPPVSVTTPPATVPATPTEVPAQGTKPAPKP